MSGTGGPVRPGDPPQLSLELLADLHAGARTERAAARLRPLVAADPRACATLAALDATVADLAALPTQCPVQMPDAVAQRLDAALAAESLAAESPEADRHPPAPLPAASPDPVIIMSGRHRLRARWIGAGVLAAAVAGVAMIGVMTGGTPRAGDALGAAAVSPAPLALSGGDLGRALDHALGARDYGPLSRPQTLRSCLDANDVPVGDRPLGARQVTLDGRPGVLLVLPSTRIDQYRLLVVGPDCAPATPSQIADGVAAR